MGNWEAGLFDYSADRYSVFACSVPLPLLPITLAVEVAGGGVGWFFIQPVLTVICSHVYCHPPSCVQPQCMACAVGGSPGLMRWRPPQSEGRRVVDWPATRHWPMRRQPSRPPVTSHCAPEASARKLCRAEQQWSDAYPLQAQAWPAPHPVLCFFCLAAPFVTSPHCAHTPTTVYPGKGTSLRTYL